MKETNNSSNNHIESRGGARKGAGRPKKYSESTIKVSLSIYLTEEDWETYENEAKIRKASGEKDVQLSSVINDVLQKNAEILRQRHNKKTVTDS
ncbi:hypothetical protein [Paenibacillus sp. 1A_MP2]|uniref:hypothetical protein n=1 Tax=Paenibacillus sp. 1A_MP2 TaxID=3457495 RepID=UPI003FCE2304